MNKDLQELIKEIGKLTYIRTISQNVGAYFHHIPVDKDFDLILQKYSKYKMEQIIHFARIEKMNDLNIIDEKEKENLHTEYQEYQKLRKIAGNWIRENIMAEYKDSEVTIEEDKNVKERLNYLEDKLTSYGIITEFNYEEALMNQIDKEAKQKKLIK